MVEVIWSSQANKHRECILYIVAIYDARRNPDLLDSYR